MRECIYCGRQLEKGEQCTCAMSVAKRREREEKEKAERPKSKAEVRSEQREQKIEGDRRRLEVGTHPVVDHETAFHAVSFGRVLDRIPVPLAIREIIQDGA